MGADLYRDDFEHLYGGPREDEWTAAIKRRDEACSDGCFGYTRDGERQFCTDECRDAQEAVSRIHEETYGHPRYFRDSYNNSSLFWKLGLSWWQDLNEIVGPEGDGVMEKKTECFESVEGKEVCEEYDDFRLHPAGMAKLYRTVEERKPTLLAALEGMKRDCDEQGVYKPTGERWEEIESYHLGKFDKFLDFLKQAAEGGHTIICSV